MAHDYISTEPTLWTYRDAVEHLMDVFQLKDVDLIGRRMRRAIDTVYRDLPYSATWSYYRRNLNFSSAAPQSTGTIAYTASTRTVTLTGATWPTDVTKYRIQLEDIDGAYYEIEKRTSDTVIVLAAPTAPSADIAASSSYRIFRAVYQLPYRFREVYKLWDADNRIPIQFSTSAQQFAESVYVWNTPQTPYRAAIRNGEDLGWMAIYLSPPPDVAIRYILDCMIEPRQLKLVQHVNVATVDAGSTPTTVTVTGTLPENIVGSIIRFSSSTAGVTSKYGDNPPVAERQIVARGSDTTLTVGAALTSSLNSVACSISDPVDIEPGAMLTAFQRGIELEYAKLAALKDVKDRNDEFYRAYLQAVGGDRRTSNADASQYPIDRFNRARVT